ncbi:MAG TPA: hypothetical protein DCE41_00680 [Cytophagales bacterium]|nr:hypothetical protein [Cytophagales bacterium]HAA23591.1 hypothetical protein [Cytophagales bacterium]HAP60729.1 hypothetical protein [Cytophagales bacterium]
MAVGTSAELILLGHYEDTWQWIPIVLLGVSLASFGLLLRKRGPHVTRLFNGLMLACGLSGILGAYFHLRANWEFEVELYPTHSNWAHFTESLSGAIPALAPGSMVVFGLLGILYTIQIKNKHT